MGKIPIESPIKSNIIGKTISPLSRQNLWNGSFPCFTLLFWPDTKICKTYLCSLRDSSVELGLRWIFCVLETDHSIWKTRSCLLRVVFVTQMWFAKKCCWLFMIKLILCTGWHTNNVLCFSLHLFVRRSGFSDFCLLDESQTPNISFSYRMFLLISYPWV